MTTAVRNRLRRVESRQNALVKALRRSFRSGQPGEDGFAAIEGPRILEEAIRSGLRFRAVFFRQSAEAQADRLLPQLASEVETLILPDDVFSSAAATETPQGVAALVKFKDFDLDDVLRAPRPLLVVLAGVQDPGNLGTVVRSAEAFGANGVLLAEKTAGRFNPKAVRASAGSIFRVPVVEVKLTEAAAKLREHGLRLVATSSHQGTPVDQAELAGALAIFLGSEGAGLPRDAVNLIDEVIAIPHSPRVESLNAGIAASILLYEAARQRGAKP
ncbi:MAG TPA: RNA methyltransferase [Terriglobales bacterium]|nr:RNA methyltransferase [Terriglobales bacterium]